MLDTCAKFFRTVHISGWIKHDQEVLLRIDMLNCEHVAQTFDVDLPHPGAANLGGPNLGFTVDILLKTEEFPFGAFICFSFSNLKQEMVPLYDLVYERLASVPTFGVYQRFLESVTAPEFHRVLDIGGRDRSQIDRREQFPANDVTVIDILPGDNVDVVGDAHSLTKYFLPDSFDAIQSISVFEHVLMPWKLVLEMNRVIRLGGLVYVHTHQALGLHDVPCDFWRFSADAWSALFNHKTGFEIVDAAMSHETFLIPHFWRVDKRHAEKSAGFEASVVLARKTAEAVLSWNVSPAEISNTAYPGTLESDPHAHIV
jgi:SAM-dependent methyltransferase